MRVNGQRAAALAGPPIPTSIDSRRVLAFASLRFRLLCDTKT